MTPLAGQRHFPAQPPDPNGLVPLVNQMESYVDRPQKLRSCAWNRRFPRRFQAQKDPRGGSVGFS
jgi:hypothetical protein